MTTYYMAIDIGASSGRHIVGWLDGGKIHLKEVYRFPNGMTERDGRRLWDVDALFEHVVEGLRRARLAGMTPAYLGIDTWGVDYVLLDKSGKRIGDVYGYRDERCERGMRAVLERVPFEALYGRTGIQRLNYNTVFQLMADRLERPEVLDEAQSLLMIPDYLGYRLTGVIHQEYTNATTGAIVSLRTGEIDKELLSSLGLPTHLFGKLSMPGERVGTLLPEVRERVGYDLTVIHPASHDTGSAVMAMPSLEPGAAYLSSGTWSLLGAELIDPIADGRACSGGFTHEGGWDKRYRFLTNIMGLWIIQSIRRELGERYSFPELSDMARSVGDEGVRINVNDARLMAPSSMISALCEVIGEQLPLDRLLGVVYHSLADLYADAIGRLSDITGAMPSALYIIGGGCRDLYLNSLTAERLDIPVYAGPVEATAIGNLMAQMISTGDLANLEEARLAVRDSFEVNLVEKCK